MKIVKQQNVINLRTKNAAVEYILRDALAHAHELEAVIVIECRRKQYDNPHGFSFSKMSHGKMAWAMNRAQYKVSKILNKE